MGRCTAELKSPKFLNQKTQQLCDAIHMSKRNWKCITTQVSIASSLWGLQLLEDYPKVDERHASWWQIAFKTHHLKCLKSKVSVKVSRRLWFWWPPPKPIIFPFQSPCFLSSILRKLPVIFGRWFSGCLGISDCSAKGQRGKDTWVFPKIVVPPNHQF